MKGVAQTKGEDKLNQKAGIQTNKRTDRFWCSNLTSSSLPLLTANTFQWDLFTSHVLTLIGYIFILWNGSFIELVGLGVTSPFQMNQRKSYRERLLSRKMKQKTPMPLVVCKNLFNESSFKPYIKDKIYFMLGSFICGGQVNLFEPILSQK